MFYLPMTAAISDQIRQITGIYDAVRNIQLAAGAAGAFAIVMPGVTLAVASYRLDRPIETTQLLNDLFWMLLLIPWPIFMAQSFSLAYAILVDSRAKPPFPKPIALVNILVPITYIPSIAVHCVKTGPVAWNGVVSFWIPIISFGIQVMVDCTCLMRAAAAADMQAY
ncbi:uncharacterized protein G6M90_00g066490 [Metarhizium brunneum]|uniref:Uncharacterized protein n=1 Tax=Metarhizium brunneum TaxID=500148 RepID=A0A7D5UYN6_9HYPO|nr:hypothetical protein G6M90_00g066490 [Metarhizium brunneum]